MRKSIIAVSAAAVLALSAFSAAYAGPHHMMHGQGGYHRAANGVNPNCPYLNQDGSYSAPAQGNAYAAPCPNGDCPYGYGGRGPGFNAGRGYAQQ